MRNRRVGVLAVLVFLVVSVCLIAVSVSGQGSLNVQAFNYLPWVSPDYLWVREACHHDSFQVLHSCDSFGVCDGTCGVGDWGAALGTAGEETGVFTCEGFGFLGAMGAHSPSQFEGYWSQPHRSVAVGWQYRGNMDILAGGGSVANTVKAWYSADDVNWSYVGACTASDSYMHFDPRVSSDFTCWLPWDEGGSPEQVCQFMAPGGFVNGGYWRFQQADGDINGRSSWMAFDFLKAERYQGTSTPGPTPTQWLTGTLHFCKVDKVSWSVDTGYSPPQFFHFTVPYTESYVVGASAEDIHAIPCSGAQGGSSTMVEGSEAPLYADYMNYADDYCDSGIDTRCQAKDNWPIPYAWGTGTPVPMSTICASVGYVNGGDVSVAGQTNVIGYGTPASQAMNGWNGLWTGDSYLIAEGSWCGYEATPVLTSTIPVVTPSPSPTGALTATPLPGSTPGSPFPGIPTIPAEIETPIVPPGWIFTPTVTIPTPAPIPTNTFSLPSTCESGDWLPGICVLRGPSMGINTPNIPFLVQGMVVGFQTYVVTEFEIFGLDLLPLLRACEVGVCALLVLGVLRGIAGAAPSSGGGGVSGASGQ